MAKIPFTFGFPFFLRVMLPGALLVTVLFPLLHPLVLQCQAVDDFLGTRTTFTDLLAEKALLAFVLGLQLSLFDDSIYRLYMGRGGWPAWLNQMCTCRLQKRVERAFDRAQAEGTTHQRRAELWAWLRHFDILDTKRAPEVSYPTLLGNTVTAYERYSLHRYGMDSVFYWHRLWLTMDKDTRAEIDARSGLADALLYASFAMLVSASMYLAVIAAGLLHASLLRQWELLGKIAGGSPSLPSLIGLCATSLLLGFVFYRASIPALRSYGETYKAMFDIFRGKIEEARHIDPDESAKWQDAWLYLQYGRTKTLKDPCSLWRSIRERLGL
jgi:hypothetical protein